VIHIMLKDLRLIVRDRRALAVLLMLPLVFITIVGLSTRAFDRSGDGENRIRLVAVDRFLQPAVEEFLEELGEDPLVTLDRTTDLEPARRQLAGGAGAALVVFDQGFGDRFFSLDLQDILDIRQATATAGLGTIGVRVEAAPGERVTQLLVAEVVVVEALHLALDRLAQRDRSVSRLLAMVTGHSLRRHGRRLEPAAIFAGRGGTGGAYETLVPSYTVLFVFFILTIMARSFIAERELGTFARLRVAPVRPAALLAGKTLPFFVISVGQSVLLFLCGKMLFGMWWGQSPWLLLPVILCTSAAATSLGLLAASFARTDAQVSAYGNLLVIALAGVSGCFMPRAWLPELMRELSLATPHAWALIAYDQLLTEPVPELHLVWQSCLALLGFAALFVAAGWWRFRSWD